MPPLPGEVLLCTLFADVHYYFAPPSSRPTHHRFDQGSYVYLYHNAIQRRGRLEIANYAGTPYQDAFDGYLDTTTIRNTQKHPHLFTITVDARHASPVSPHAEHAKWHLPAYDLRNEQKYLYKIHTLDIYFWTTNDSTLFLDSTERTMADQQLQYDMLPPQEHHDSMSPVVQQLEQAAIGGPYRQRAGSTATTQSFPGPPTGPAHGLPHQQSAPAPYNPAAPAAPEPIAYREKTPPPVDGASGTGLTAAAMHEHPTQYVSAPPLSQHPSYQQTPQQSYFPGPPQRTTSASYGALGHTQGTPSSFPPPPPGQSPQPHPSFSSSQPQPPSQVPLPLSPPPTTTSFHQSMHSQPQTQYASFPSHQSTPYLHTSNPLHSPGLPPTPGHPPAYSTHTPLQSPGFAPSMQSLQSPGLPPPPPPPGQPGHQHTQSHPQPPGGYSNYSYAQQQQQPLQQQEAYSVHSQMYRPTEAEAAHGAKPLGTKPVQAQGGPGARPGGLEERLGKMEKGVGRFLKKLDQKF